MENALPTERAGVAVRWAARSWVEDQVANAALMEAVGAATR